MAKVSPVTIKYIIYADFVANGVVEKPDVIGAIFGQTEGLLGKDLELRDLQRSGKIGRIDAKLRVENGKTYGTIIVPTSVDKVETCLIAAMLETVERIGPTTAKIKVKKIEDVRHAKRLYIIERAKELLKQLLESQLPDTKEIILRVEQSLRMMEIQEYGPEKLPAGPSIEESEEIIVVEGRADVLNLLKHGIQNVIAINGSRVPKTIIELSKKKTIIVFVDGDRGGDLIVKELYLAGVDIDFVAKAPAGKEVEDLTRKEILKALRNKIPFDQVKGYYEKLEGSIKEKEEKGKVEDLKEEEIKKFKEYLDSIFATRAVLVLDKNLNIINKLPITRISDIEKLNTEIYALVLDSIINNDLVNFAKKKKIKVLVGTDSSVSVKGDEEVKIITLKQLEK